jgi:hypothetical protein
VSKLKNYLARDYASFRTELLTYARTYFPTKINDFNEAGLGGMFIDMAAYIGDNLSFYLDHQFNELDPSTAVEFDNITMHARNAGVTISGKAPAVAEVTLYIDFVPTKIENGEILPDLNFAPVIKAFSSFSTNAGIVFTLLDDCDFAEKDFNGNLIADVVADPSDTNNVILIKKALVVSGEIVTEEFSFGAVPKPFRKITLANSNISRVVSVIDSASNKYHEVESLSQDTVFEKIDNPLEELSILRVSSAQYRFTTETNILSRKQTLTFGGGDIAEKEDDLVPDPSELSLPLFGRTTLSKFSIDPKNLLKTKTLGITPTNTTISVIYQYGGGLDHNVSPETITNINVLDMVFSPGLSFASIELIRNSLVVKNETEARGGANALTVDEIKEQILSAKNLQNRIVSKADLLARIYSLPNEFGRVYRATVVPNENNPLSTNLFVLSQDANGHLSQSPNLLKKNIKTYLNEFRLISDAIDILDAKILNFQINVSVITLPTANKLNVRSKIDKQLRSLFLTRKRQIGQPIVEMDIFNAIAGITGVFSIPSIEIKNINGNVEDRTYSKSSFNLIKEKGVYFIQTNSILELKYPDSDIIISIQ